MSSWMDGLSSIYSITAKIEALKNQANSAGSNLNTQQETDPQEALYAMEQNFSSMLNSLLASSDDEDKEKNSNALDFLFNSTQTSTTNSTLENYLNINSSTGTTNTQGPSQDTALYASQLAQYNLNLNNII